MESKRIPGNVFHILKRCVAACQLIVAAVERKQCNSVIAACARHCKCACAFLSTVDIRSLENLHDCLPTLSAASFQDISDVEQDRLQKLSRFKPDEPDQ